MDFIARCPDLKVFLREQVRGHVRGEGWQGLPLQARSPDDGRLCGKPIVPWFFAFFFPCHCLFAPLQPSTHMAVSQSGTRRRCLCPSQSGPHRTLLVPALAVLPPRGNPWRHIRTSSFCRLSMHPSLLFVITPFEAAKRARAHVFVAIVTRNAPHGNLNRTSTSQYCKGRYRGNSRYHPIFRM